MRNASALVIALLACAACRASGTGGDDTSAHPDANNASPDGPAGSQSVASIRQNQPTNGAAINLHQVVVVARVSSSKSGRIWVQDQGGGPYSGIEVYCSFTSTSHPCTMTRAQIDALNIGQVVDVAGSFDVYTPSMPAGAQPSLEISQPTITADGGTMQPVAMTASASDISKDMATGAMQYKGAYVHVTGPFTVSSTSPSEFQGTCTGSGTPPTMGTQYRGFEVTGGGATLAVGLDFYSTLTYCLPDTCGHTCSNQVTNQTFTNITGVVEANYNTADNSVFLNISPVTDADLPTN